LNSNLKDNIPPEKISGIYQINCKDCEKINIGKTKRNLETRVKKHFRNIKMEK
jgi:GIY-YIG catalytic domain.